MMNVSPLFADHMVLQRNKPIPVFGTGNGTVCVEFRGNKVETQASFAHWCVWLPAEEAGGPYEMKITLCETVSVSHAESTVQETVRIFSDILVGEVWIAAGQSNMSMRLENALHSESDLSACPNFRYTNISRGEWPEVTEALDKKWTVCTPDVCADFSAIGHFFARELILHENVPVGIIACCKGASRIESWIDPTILAGTELDIPNERKFIDIKYPFNAMGRLYYEMLCPIAPYSVRGVLWYQGESDRSPHETCTYSGLFGLLLKSWRKRWNEELPFLTVQLTSYGENTDQTQDWPTLREQQRIAAEKFPNVAMITTMDCGSPNQIHPVHKRELGERLVRAARNLVYGETNVEYSGPLAEKAFWNGEAVTVTFSHAANGLCAETLADLEMRGADGIYYPAEGKISADGCTLELRCVQVAQPRGVRYAWKNFCEVTLKNAEGFPAAPFLLTVETE